MVPRYCAVAPLDGPCCTSRAHPDRSTIPGITREGFAESPSECEATCFATTGCHAFSHSVKRRQCVFCSDCAAARQASAKSRGVFTGWRRQREGETFATLADAVDVSGHRFWPGQISVGNLSRTVAAAEAALRNVTVYGNAIPSGDRIHWAVVDALQHVAGVDATAARRPPVSVGGARVDVLCERTEPPVAVIDHERAKRQVVGVARCVLKTRLARDGRVARRLW